MDSPPQPTTLSGGPAIAIRAAVANTDLSEFFASAFAELTTCAGAQVHTGPYDQLGTAYQAIDRWLADHQRDPSDAVREVHLTDPVHAPDPQRWITVVIQPVRPS